MPEQEAPIPASVVSAKALTEAIERGQLKLFYQPQVDMSSGRVRGVEALVRWIHPEFGLLLPDEFIRIAEGPEIVEMFTRWVLDQAFRQLATWNSRGMRLRMSVNLSPANLHDGALPDEIAQGLKTWGIDPSLLELEITEGSVVSDPVAAKQVLSRLSKMGVELALDDFGTGYSTLSYLKMLPVSTIKLDKSFVMSMVQNEQDDRIVHSTIELARSLRLRVVAEGVDSQETWSRLSIHGADLAQGFFISPALPADELVEWMESWEGPALGNGNGVAHTNGSHADSTRVLVVEDHTLLRQSLVKAMSAEPGFEVVGQSGRGDDAIQAVSNLQPNLALLDIELPGGDGLEVAHELRQNHPDIRIVFLTMREDEQAIRGAIDLGADGYVLKTASTEELIDAVRAVAAGGSYLTPSVARRVVSMAGVVARKGAR